MMLRRMVFAISFRCFISGFEVIRITYFLSSAIISSALIFCAGSPMIRLKVIMPVSSTIK